MRDGRVNFISHPNPAQHSDEKVANRDVRDFGWAIAHAAVSPRPPNPSYTIVTRTEGYTCDAKVWDLSIVQGPLSVPLFHSITIRNFCIAGRGVATEPRTACCTIPTSALRNAGNLSWNSADAQGAPMKSTMSSTWG
jgi:hypothetical protein